MSPEISNGEIFLWVILHTEWIGNLKLEVWGVFILVRDNIVCSEQAQFHTNCEMVWVKLEVTGVHTLYICAYYKPKEDDQESLLELRWSLEEVKKHAKGNI